MHGVKTNDKKFYSMWSDLKNRCDNPFHRDYINYGGRGIQHKYKYFVDFYDDCHSDYSIACKKYGRENIRIDREDNNSDYVRGNIRFVTHEVSALNRRIMQDRFHLCVHHNGELEGFSCVKEFSRLNGFGSEAIFKCMRGENRHHRYSRFLRLTKNLAHDQFSDLFDDSDLDMDYEPYEEDGIDLTPYQCNYYMGIDEKDTPWGFVNISEMSRVFSLSQSRVEKCIRDENLALKGWQFYRISRDEFEEESSSFEWLESWLGYQNFIKSDVI